MAYFKALILFALAACALAAEEAARPKKDVLVASPYTVPLAYSYDDGSYFPGKYERTYVASHAAYPAAYAAYPYSYSAYPYAYSAYPYRSYVY